MSVTETVRSCLTPQTVRNIGLSDQVQSQLDLNIYKVVAGWLLDVKFAFKAEFRTLMNALKLLSLYYTHNPVVQKDIQITACACLDLSCNAIETPGPCPSDFVYISSNSFTGHEFIQVKIRLVNFFNGRIRQLTVYDVFDQLIYDGHQYQNEQRLALIVCVLDHRFLSIDPVSVVEACVDCYARATTRDYGHCNQLVMNVLKTMSGIPNSIAKMVSDVRAKEFISQYDSLFAGTPTDVSSSFHARETPELSKRESLSGYTQISILGSGISGMTVLAKRGTSSFAIKRISTSDSFESAVRELSVLTTYNHENIVKCRSFSIESNTVELELELGTPLNKLVGASFTSSYYWDDVYVRGHARSKVLADRRDLMEDIVRGVKYLHSVGVLHRDLKTSNIIVVDGEPRRTAKIIDFSESICMINTTNDRSSKSAEIVTLPYRPPELIVLEDSIKVLYLGSRYSPEDIDRELISSYTYAVDIWSVGVILLEIETGCFPFPIAWVDKVETVLYDICKLLGPPQPNNPYTVNAYSWIPYKFEGLGLSAVRDAQLRDVILKMLNFDPALRKM